MSVDFTPIHDFVLVAPLEERNRMENGLFMPDQAIVDGEPAKGKVIAVGAEVKQVKEGDILLWDRKNYAQTVVFDTQKYALLRESMAFGVLED